MNKNDFRIVSGYTIGTPYKESAESLLRSLKKHNIEDCEIVPYPNTGSWARNCHHKAVIIKQQLMKHNKPIVWLDADAEVCMYPSLFHDIEEEIAYCMRYHGTPCASGTVFFKPTDSIFKLIDLWIDRNNEFIYKKEKDIIWDQNSLHECVVKTKVSPYNLPFEYCKIFDNPQCKHIKAPVILHNQHSRKNKAVINTKATRKVFYKNEGCHIDIPESSTTRHDKYVLNWYPKRDGHEVVFRLLIRLLYDYGFLDKNKNIIDIGAWIGDNTIPWAYKIKGSGSIGGKVFAIDPCTENLEYISKLCEINNVDNVVILQEIASNVIEDVYAPAKRDPFHTSFNPKGDGAKFTTVTLDGLHDENILRNIEFLHLDVEGFEQKVLEGSIKLICINQPLIVWENHLNKDDYRKTISFLKSLGYVTYIINDDLIGCREDCTNFFSVPKRMKRLLKSIEIINDLLDHGEDFKQNKKHKDKPALIEIKIDNTSRENLVRSFEGMGVELGVAAGLFSKTILDNSSCELLYSIDRWGGDRGHDRKQFSEACNLLSPYKERSRVMLSTFKNVVDWFDNESFDFIYIDGYAHNGQEEGGTLKDWWPKLKQGGIFAGRDYDIKKWPKNVEAVDNFSKSVERPIETTQETVDKSWYIIK